MIGAFKTVSTKQMNAIRGDTSAPIWQCNYYEHIVRTEEELNRIRAYIAANPEHWNIDENNPARVSKQMSICDIQ